jgi:HTH-type transcriptional regulator/antitoxin HipB
MQNLILTPFQLAYYLKSRRKSLNLTQKQAGELVGLLPKTISAMESHPERCSLESFFKLLSALEIEMLLQPKPLIDEETEKDVW